MIEPKLVEFETSDGLNLPGLLYEAKGSKKVIIYLHRNGSSSIFYNEIEHRDLPQALVNKGFSFLKFNNRGAHIIKTFKIKKNDVLERVSYGTAFEKIKDCLFDIDAALAFLEKLGYTEFYLVGSSTGANKICVYDHYKPNNLFKKYVLICGGDDAGSYYDELGDKLFFKLLSNSKEKIKNGKGGELITELASNGVIFSYQGFYDIANPDGDYNCFPYLEAFGRAKLSSKPLFRYFAGIKKDSFIVYWENDEYTWGNIKGVITTLKKYQPEFDYKVIKGADHGFTGKEQELAKAVSDWVYN